MTSAPRAPRAEARSDASAVQSVDRALQILELIAEHRTLPIADIAQHLGVHRTTAFRLLATLEGRRFVTRTPQGAYALGAGALRIAGSVTTRVDFAREAQAICDEVTATLGETSNVAIFVEGAAVNVAQATGASSVAVRDQFVGQRTPAHATSSGKVLLAYAGEEARAAVAGDLERFSDRTITTREALLRELDRIVERGWAAAQAEWQEHTHAVAVPVWSDRGDVIAALSATAPAFRMPESSFESLASSLEGFAERFSRRIGSASPV